MRTTVLIHLIEALVAQTDGKHREVSSPRCQRRRRRRLAPRECRPSALEWLSNTLEARVPAGRGCSARASRERCPVSAHSAKVGDDVGAAVCRAERICLGAPRCRRLQELMQPWRSCGGPCGEPRSGVPPEIREATARRAECGGENVAEFALDQRDACHRAGLARRGVLICRTGVPEATPRPPPYPLHCPLIFGLPVRGLPI